MKTLLPPVTSTVSALALALSVIVVLYAPPRPLTVVNGAEGGVGTGEDPNGRVEWEMVRLRDPASGFIPAGIRSRELTFAATLPIDGEESKSGTSRDLAAASWTPLGPYNVGGRTRALGIDIANDQVMLAGGVSGGMWRSVDGGGSWTKVTGASQLQAVSCIAQDLRPGKSHIWYYGSGGEVHGSSPKGGGAAYNGDGVFKSTDNGATWTALASTISGTPHVWDGAFDYIWKIVTDPSSGVEGEIYAACYGGIYRSTDEGAGWQPVLGDISTRALFTDIAITATGVLYATLSSDGSVKGIWRSTDGITWKEITPAGWPAEYRRVVIGIAPSNPNQVYFLGNTPGSGSSDHSLWSYSYLSGDGSAAGGVWENRSSSLPTAESTGSWIGLFDSQGSYDMAIAVKPDDERVVFIGGTNLYRSTDGFSSAASVDWIGGYTPSVWQVINHHCDQQTMAFSPNDPNVLFSGHDGGISKTLSATADKVSWISLNNGYSTGQFYTIALSQDRSSNTMIMGGQQDNGTWITSDRKTRWRSTFGGYGNYAGDGGYCAVVDSNTVYYSLQGGEIYRLNPSDSGKYGTYLVPEGADGFAFIAPFAVDPNDSRRLYLAAGGTVWRNTNLDAIPANNWRPTKINWSKLDNTTSKGAPVSALATSAIPADRLYYGTRQGTLFRIDNVSSASPDDTIAARDITGESFPAGAFVTCIAVDPHNADNLIAAFSNYGVRSLFYSEDGGARWTDISGNLEENPDGSGAGPSCRWVEILHTLEGPIYLVGTSTGLYSTRSLEGAAVVWTQEGAETIGNVVVDMIDSREHDGTVVIGTHGNGAFARTFGATTSVDGQDVIESRFTLGQNHPNPAYDQTTISFYLPHTARATLTFYDAGGKVLSTPLDAMLNAGEHRHRVQVGSLASGTYFYRLTAAGDIQTRRMVVER